MALVTGTLIGRYAIGNLLGAGGMGEVYRAHDLQLDRDVAVKVLPHGFADNPDSMRRFEQEARATAALSHPGVLGIYDVGEHDGRPYLVTELLEGVTLRERLNTERLPVESALRYAIEVASALAAAHAKGIVHRDIKPENLFITTGDHIKILDFGLAKLKPPPAAGQTLGDVTFVGTLPNTVLGTVGYMAPEQARGQAVDHRADIFSLGCVLFELLEGRGPFARPTPADSLTAILSEPPPELTTSVHRQIPPALRLILGRAVEKDPQSRFQSASDMAFALSSLTQSAGTPAPHEASAESAPAAKTRWSRYLAGTALAVAAFAAAGFWLGARLAPSARPAPIEFLVPPPATELTFAPSPLPGLDPTAPQVGVSPDGRTVAFVTLDPTGVRRLWTRSMDSGTPRSVEGSDGVSSWPFWSPDSRFLAFAANGVLWKVETTTRTIERLCKVPDQGAAVPFVTGSWRDDEVVFSIGPAGLYRVPASGGQAERITQRDQARHENYHSWPQLLPGKRLLLFVRTDDVKTTGVYAGTIGSTGMTQVLATASRAVYAGGYLLWMIDDRLVAQAFDPGSLGLSGQPATLVPSVFQGAGRSPAFWASDTGTLVYAVGSGGGSQRQFRWLSRAGASLGDAGAPGNYASFDLSPDGGRIVAEIRKDGAPPRSTLALLDTSRMVLSALTAGERNDTDPRFGPEGDIVFARNSDGEPGIVRIAREGAPPELMVQRGKAAVIWLEDWAGTNGGIVYRSALNPDAWRVLRGGAPRQLTKAHEPVEQIQASPDGRWIAYNNADSGRPEVYVSSTTGGGERWQISDAGGVQALWRADGRELYYLGLDGGIYVVAIGSRVQAPEPSKPRLLFRSKLPVISAVVEQYRVTRDGERFLFCVPLTSVQQEPLRVVLNWEARLSPSH
jgi:eukaryotic-like serine/threonine-protein kinase